LGVGITAWKKDLGLTLLIAFARHRHFQSGRTQEREERETPKKEVSGVYRKLAARKVRLSTLSLTNTATFWQDSTQKKERRGTLRGRSPEVDSAQGEGKRRTPGNKRKPNFVCVFRSLGGLRWDNGFPGLKGL